MMTLTIRGQAVKIYGRIHPQLVDLIPTVMDCMIWQGMFGNGAQTGMMRITTQVRLNVIPPGPVQGNGEFCAAVRGVTSVRTTCAAPLVTTPTLRLTRTTFSDFVAVRHEVTSYWSLKVLLEKC